MAVTALGADQSDQLGQFERNLDIRKLWDELIQLCNGLLERVPGDGEEGIRMLLRYRARQQQLAPVLADG